MSASLINGIKMLIILVREAFINLIVLRACAMSPGGIGLSVVRPILKGISQALNLIFKEAIGFAPLPREFGSGRGIRQSRAGVAAATFKEFWNE